MKGSSPGGEEEEDEEGEEDEETIAEKREDNTDKESAAITEMNVDSEEPSVSPDGTKGKLEQLEEQ